MPRPVRTGRESLRRRSGDGIRLLAANKRLRWMFVSAFVLDLAFGWPIEVALPLLAKQHHWGAQAVGTVIATFSFGALVSGAIGALLGHRLPPAVRLVVTGAGIAAGISVMALMPSVATLGVVAAGVGMMSGLNGPAIVTTYQQAAPRRRMGAAMSTLTLAGIGTGPMSIAVFSSLSVGIGLQRTWLMCGLVALAGPVAAAFALRSPMPPPDEAAQPPAPDAAPLRPREVVRA